MIEEARSAGAILKTRTVNTIVLGKNGGRYVPPDAQAPINDSMTRGWSVLEAVPRFKRRHIPTSRRVVAGLYIPWFEQRVVPNGAKIHASVFEHDGGQNALERKNMPSDYEVIE